MVDRGSIGLHDSSKSANFTTGDRRSSGLQWNSEVENAQKSWENRPRKCFMQENNRLTSRQSSVDSVAKSQHFVTSGKQFVSLNFSAKSD